mmetsp:Transcript_21357/g.63841  ORF Transcript_21357/g.63841 Transcript_21357/m.63841 type:complete len:213 (+) Transcript_21357:458-1096(+)
MAPGRLRGPHQAEDGPERPARGARLRGLLREISGARGARRARAALLRRLVPPGGGLGRGPVEAAAHLPALGAAPGLGGLLRGRPGHGGLRPLLPEPLRALGRGRGERGRPRARVGARRGGLPVPGARRVPRGPRGSRGAAPGRAAGRGRGARAPRGRLRAAARAARGPAAAAAERARRAAAAVRAGPGLRRRFRARPPAGAAAAARGRGGAL